LVKLHEQISSNIVTLEEEVKREEENKKNRAKELNSAFDVILYTYKPL